MNIWTYQIAKWRHVNQLGIPAIDTTVKSGAIQLAPSWDIVIGHKKGVISDQQYTEVYNKIITSWWFTDPEFFERLMSYPTVALGCYCSPGKFCHRHLIVDFLRNITHVNYMGEIT